MSLAGGAVLGVLVATALLAPAIFPTDPTATNLPERLRPPAWIEGGSVAHLLGTDGLGRDVLIRILYGARISLLIGFTASLIAAGVGIPLGLLSGYYGGALDVILMRLVDIQLGFPSILLYIAVLAVVRPNLWTMTVILGVAGWVIHARLMRAQALAQRQFEYVDAARAMGAGDGRILLRHVLPNVLAPSIVITSFSVATFIITASSLSFLGLGLPPSTPDWGIMISDAVRYMRVAWWPSAFAGLALSLTVFSVSVLGDRLRDFLDPRLRLES
ncbi:MAG: ABC transporter permease [Armatimonadetes bacterium]|nr:ABC transporter permease [Armatimonadota bacterium]